jgi:O-antigen ligase
MIVMFGKYLTSTHAMTDRGAKLLLLAAVFFMPISTAATNICMGLTLLAWLIAGGFHERFVSLRDNWFAVGTVGLFLMVCAGSIHSTAESAEILFQIHKYAKLLFMLPAITLLQEDKWRERALLAFSIAMLITLALSLISVVWPLSFVRGTVGGPSDNHFVFRDHIAQNLMMSFFALLLAVKGRFAVSSTKKSFFWVLALVSVIDILFFVAGRTGYVSLIFNMLVFLLFLGSLKKSGIALLVCFIIGIMTIQFSTTFKSRVDLAVTEYRNQDNKDLSSVGQRIEFIKKGILLIEERPLIGFGTGAHKKEFCRVAETKEWCNAGGFHPHNQFIAFGVQLGILGILGYLLFMMTAIKEACNANPEKKILGFGLVATLIADSLFHAPLFLISEAAFFILLFPVLMSGSTVTKPKITASQKMTDVF